MSHLPPHGPGSLCAAPGPGVSNTKCWRPQCVPKDSEHMSMHSCASGCSFCKISARKGADSAEHPLNSSKSKHNWSELGHTEKELEALG